MCTCIQAAGDLELGQAKVSLNQERADELANQLRAYAAQRRQAEEEAGVYGAWALIGRCLWRMGSDRQVCMVHGL